MASTLSIAAALLLTAANPSKPAAVTICFEGLPKELPLFTNAPAKNYRQAGEELYVLDVSVRLNDAMPQRISRGKGEGCLKAWLPAQWVDEISASFERTDTNLLPVSRKTKLKLKPDLWYDGGSLAVEQGQFSSVSANLPGKVELVRLPPFSPELGRTSDDLKRVASGSYQLNYRPPPPPEIPCEISLKANAEGTVTETKHPEVLREIVENYRRGMAPSILSLQGVKCHAGDHVNMQISINDGVVYRPLEPTYEVTSKPPPPPEIHLVRDGKRAPFKFGTKVAIQYGESLVLEEQPRELADNVKSKR